MMFPHMHMDDLSKKELLTVEDFFALYSIKRSTFYAEVRKGNIRITKVGARTYITRGNAQAWIRKLEEHAY